MRELSSDVQAAERFASADLDGWEARVIDLAQNRDLRRAPDGTAYGPDASREIVWRAYETTLAALDDFQRAADSDLASLLSVELREVVDRVRRAETARRRAGLVDLLLRARSAGRASGCAAGVPTAVHSHLRDEFQDTDPLQAEILLLLAADSPSSPTGVVSTRCRASCSSSAIRSRPSTASGGPTSRRIRRCAICSKRAAPGARSCTRASGRLLRFSRW